MTRHHIIDIVVAEAARTAGVDAATLGADTLIADMPLDSLQEIELVVALEDALGLEIGCADRITIDTLGGYASLAERRAARMPLAA